MEKIEISFEQLMKIHDNAKLCNCHNEELSKILNMLNKFYQSINFDSNSNDESYSSNDIDVEIELICLFLFFFLFFSFYYKIDFNSSLSRGQILKSPHMKQDHSAKQYIEGGELDFQKLLGKFPGLPWAKYKGEKHLPGHNFTGAQTDLKQRLDENNNVKDGNYPVNRVDAAAMRHDIFYRDQ